MSDEIESISLAPEQILPDAATISSIKAQLKTLFLLQDKNLAAPKNSDFGHEEGTHLDLDKRRAELVAWLSKNRLPVKLDEQNVINILDTVFIRAPYSLDDCQSTNEIILDKVRQLVRCLPESWNSKNQNWQDLDDDLLCNEEKLHELW